MNPENCKKYSFKNSRKITALSAMVICMILLSGCMIPYSVEVDSENVIGARAGAAGKVSEQIVHRDKKLNIIVLGLPEIVRTSWFGYSRYAVLTEHGEQEIEAMEHFPSLAWTKVDIALPIPDSDRWITYETNGCNQTEYDICLVIFSVSEGQILRQRFRRVKRKFPKGIGLFWLYIEGNSDLSWLRVHETDKITRINTNTGELVPETPGSPAFTPAAYDHKKLQELCKQPPLNR